MLQGVLELKVVLVRAYFNPEFVDLNTVLFFVGDVRWGVSCVHATGCSRIESSPCTSIL